MENYYVFYKDENNEFHCYYPNTKDYKILLRIDLNAHRFEILKEYLSKEPDKIKKSLKKYNKDLYKWMIELRDDEYNIDYLKRHGTSEYYNTLNYMVERVFKRFCGKYIKDMDVIDNLEYEWMTKCYNSGLQFISESIKNEYNKGEYHSDNICVDDLSMNGVQNYYGYDFKSSYQKDLLNIHISTKKGKEYNLKKLPKKLQHGYYNVSIYTSDENDKIFHDETIKKLFSFSKYNVYTHDQLDFARTLQKKYSYLKIELVKTASNNNCYLYEDTDIIKCNKVFYLWNKVLSTLRDRYPKNKLVKYLGSYLWGVLSKRNIIKKTVEEITEEKISFKTGKYKFVEQYYDKQGEIKYIEMIHKENPFKHNIRLMPAITSYGRIKIAKLAMTDLKHVYRIQTDNITFNKEHKELESENLKLEEKTTGIIRWIDQNKYHHKCPKCNVFYSYQNGHEC